MHTDMLRTTIFPCLRG